MISCLFDIFQTMTLGRKDVAQETAANYVTLKIIILTSSIKRWKRVLPDFITCYCPRKMLLLRRQIIRRKLCFYYTCKFGVISIKYVIIHISTICIFINNACLNRLISSLGLKPSGPISRSRADNKGNMQKAMY
jgi:hypothetical protein